MQQQVRYGLAIVFPLLIAAGLVAVAEKARRSATFIEAQLWPLQSKLRRAEFVQATALEAHFEGQGYGWLPAPGLTVPLMALTRMPRDLSEVNDVNRKKALFFRALLPIVLAENRNIRIQRRNAEKLLEKGYERLNVAERTWLDSLTKWYRVSGDVSLPDRTEVLMRRVDEVPVALVLAQAANESAWGTSRFAQEANNLFGQWVFDDSKGLVPLERGENEKHSVRMFETVVDSVRAYMRNLNTHRAYSSLRTMRQTSRSLDMPLDASELAAGLTRYSQRGGAYVEELRALIRVNKLDELAAVDLALEELTEVPLVAFIDAATTG